MPQRDNKKKAIKRLTEENHSDPVLTRQRNTLYAEVDIKPVHQRDSDGLNIEAEYKYVEAIEYASAGQIKALETFIAKGGDVNEANEFGTTAVTIAASRNDYKMLTILVEKGHADISVKDSSGRSAMDWAILYGNKRMQDYISNQFPDNKPRYK